MIARKFEKCIIAASVSVLAAVMLLVRWHCGGENLILSDPESGRVYARYPIQDGERFSIGFIHSVNQSPLVDVYEMRGREIYVVETIYYGFGAGVQTELEEGQTLTYVADGAMVISGFKRRIEDLQYRVGTVSDHILIIGGQGISLRTLCGKNAEVRFSCERCLFSFERGWASVL